MINYYYIYINSKNKRGVFVANNKPMGKSSFENLPSEYNKLPKITLTKALLKNIK